MAVISVTEDQVENLTGNLEPVFSITFNIPDKPGTFTVTVPQSGDPVAAASQAISDLEARVNGIYGL